MRPSFRAGLCLLAVVGLLLLFSESRSPGFWRQAVKKKANRQKPDKTHQRSSRRPGGKTPPPGSEQAVKAFMRAKLTAMRHILDGLATEDYDQIRKSAEKMRAMSTKVEWNIVQGPIYGEYSTAFRRNADLLSKAAREKNIDGAALIYMNLTMNCINCHRFNREREKTVFFPGD